MILVWILKIPRADPGRGPEKLQVIMPQQQVVEDATCPYDVVEFATKFVPSFAILW
jgi:hypothetical protein